MNDDRGPQQLAGMLGLPFYAQIDDHRADERLLDRLPLAFARSRSLLPLSIEDGRLLLAVANPTDLFAQDEVSKRYGMPVQAVVVPQDEVLAAINRLYTRTAGTARDVVENLTAEDLSAIASELAHPHDLLDAADEAPVIRLLNAILFQAVKERASDIHIEPYERNLEVRFRIDGLLQLKLEPPRMLQEALASRVKIMANLDIAEKRLPQDGRFKVLVAGREVDLRVSIVPTSFGERIVIRLLDRAHGIKSLHEIGFSAEDTDRMERLLVRTSGIILVTGPTGSGKTTTLYAALSRLNRKERNIITIEDPIEYQLDGIGQIQVNPKIDLTFASGLRAVLRQDPDVIMVGEIRDLETAEIAIKAAQTGHLVLSTLHTNDAPQTLTRLANMGVPPYNIASSILLIIAQRLARRLCPNCKAPDNVPREELLREGFTPEEIDAGLTIFKPVGCDQCTEGYKGRVGVYQVMPISEEMGRIIMRGGTSLDLADQARKEGVRDLRASGLLKVKAGLIGLEELNRVTVD